MAGTDLDIKGVKTFISGQRSKLDELGRHL
jgi:hypothetical protein